MALTSSTPAPASYSTFASAINSALDEEAPAVPGPAPAAAGGGRVGGLAGSSSRRSGGGGGGGNTVTFAAEPEDKGETQRARSGTLRQRRTNKHRATGDNGGRKVRVVGRGWSLRAQVLDMYYHLLAMRWPIFVLVVTAWYCLAAAFYFALFCIDIDGFSPRPQRLRQLYFHALCVMIALADPLQANTTNDYTTLASIACAFTGLLSTAVTTGVVFARLSRPTARVQWSRVATIGLQHLSELRPNDAVAAAAAGEDTPNATDTGDTTAATAASSESVSAWSSSSSLPTLPTLGGSARCLEIRVANARAAHIAEATVRLTLAITLPEGGSRSKFRRVFDLELRRDWTPLFHTFPWTIHHVIDERSPLFGLTPQHLKAGNAVIVAMLTGVDASFNDQIHSFHDYYMEDVVFDARHSDMLTHAKDSITIDFSKLDLAEGDTDADSVPLWR